MAQSLNTFMQVTIKKISEIIRVHYKMKRLIVPSSFLVILQILFVLNKPVVITVFASTVSESSVDVPILSKRKNLIDDNAKGDTC